jgi:hypothetical protein
MRDGEGRKSDGEGTFAGTRGNDEDAPIAAIPWNSFLIASFERKRFVRPHGNKLKNRLGRSKAGTPSSKLAPSASKFP